MSIITHNQAPYGWSAHEDTLDVDFDYKSGTFVALGPVGHGATKEAAIRDLVQQIEDLGPVDERASAALPQEPRLITGHRE